MIEQLGWDSLEARRLFFQASMFYKILMGHVGISFPPDSPPDSRPFQQISVPNDVYKYSFYPRTIVTWNNLPINDDVNKNNFKCVALVAIKSFE